MSMSRVDPRIRAYGKARIDITRRAKDEEEWQRQWKEPRYPFPFTWGQGWKHSIQYQVIDFAAEVGFLMDVLGLPAYAFSPSYAIFTSPDQAFAFSVASAPDNYAGTPPDSIRIQFMVGDIFTAVEELERRGVVFEQRPQPFPGQAGYLYRGCFRTPHGVCIDLLGTDSLPTQSTADAVINQIEEAGEENLETGWQEMERPPVEVSADEQEETVSIKRSETGEIQETEPDDGDPFAGLNLPQIREPSKEINESLGFGEEKTEEDGTIRDAEGSNGSSGLRKIQTPPGSSNRRTGHRQIEGLPHSGKIRGSGSRGNGELRQSDPDHRKGNVRRKNPFNIQDLPPLPNSPLNIDRHSNKQKDVPNPFTSASPPEETHSSTFPESGDDQKQNGKMDFLPEQVDSVEDEPRYEDLEDAAGKDLEDFYP